MIEEQASQATCGTALHWDGRYLLPQAYKQTKVGQWASRTCPQISLSAICYTYALTMYPRETEGMWK